MPKQQLKKQKTRNAARPREGHKSAGSLIAVKDVSILKFQDLLGLRKAKWLSRLVSALDTKLIGIIPAVIEPALIRWKAGAEANKITKLSKARTDAHSYRVRELARARVDALKTNAEIEQRGSPRVSSQDVGVNIYERTLVRMRNSEIGYQENLEEVVGLAVQYLLNSPYVSKNDPSKHSISGDWMDRWIHGAKGASDGDVRDLWARILSSEVTQEHQATSLQLIETLRFVDGEMARYFSKCAPQMYLVRFLGGEFGSEEPRAAIRLALAGLMEELKKGVHDILFQTCVFRISFKSLRFERAYRLTSLGTELFEALNPTITLVRAQYRTLSREPLVNASGKKNERAIKTLKGIRKYLPNSQLTYLAKFITELVELRLLHSINIYRYFPDLTGRENFVVIKGDEHSVRWESMSHEVVSILSKRGGNGYKVTARFSDKLDRQITSFERRVISNLKKASQAPSDQVVDLSDE